jgi:hypothetical protein
MATAPVQTRLCAARWASSYSAINRRARRLFGVTTTLPAASAARNAGGSAAKDALIKTAARNEVDGQYRQKVRAVRRLGNG